jgi:hypothetical protein
MRGVPVVEDEEGVPEEDTHNGTMDIESGAIVICDRNRRSVPSVLCAVVEVSIRGCVLSFASRLDVGGGGGTAVFVVVKWTLRALIGWCLAVVTTDDGSFVVLFSVGCGGGGCFSVS